MKILQKNQIEQFLKSVSKYFEDNLYFSDSQNKHAIVTEIQSNLSIYIRSTNFYEDLLKYNLIEENENLEDLIDNIIYENNTEILEKIIEISFVHNLTVNKITSNNKIDCIANSNVNFLSPADGISFVNENEIIISYASTSYEMKKKDDKIISEILDAINLLNNDEKILYLSFMNKWKDYVLKVTKNLPFIDRLISISEEQRKILNSIKKILNDNINDKTREVLLKKFIKQTYNKKNISLEEMINLIDNQKLKNKSLKKEIKISISDNSFNSKEMFKIFLEVRDYIKNDTIKSLVLENIKTGSSVVFNKEKLELFNSIYKEKFDKISNVFITKDHLKFKESSFLKELINDLYINHFNINAQETLDMNLLEKNYKELNNFFKEKEEIKKIIIEKGKYENYQLLTKSYFSRLLVHLKTIKVYYDSKTIFEIDSFSENSNEIFLKELDGILKLSKDYNELDLVLVLKFLKEMYELNKDNKDKLTQHIISLTSTYVNAKLNKYYKTMTNNEKNNIIQYINELFENNEIIYFNKENSFFELNEEDLELEYSSNKDIIQDMETGESLSSLELDEEFFEKSSSLEKIGNLYFKEFIENNENLIEEEKTQLIENFIDKTFGGKEHIALEHALTDTIIKNNFSQGQTEIKKRMENFFFKKNVKKEKCFIIIVDYDNDGTLAKLSAEETKPYLQKKLGKYYENSDDVFVVYTQNANNTRGLTKFDFELVAKNFKTDKDIFIMTADNGTSNIEQINNILKTKKIVNNNGKTININVNNIIITDHHPMDATIENDIKKFYIENSDKVLLFNPVYVYSINNKSNEYEIIESNEKNVSGATTFIQSINFLFDKNNDKDTIKYLEWLSKISNVVDYVDTLHAEINDYSKINEVLLVAKRINILQKFTIYFYNILNSLDEKVFNSKKDYFYAIENLKEPLNKLALLFSRNLLENNIYFEELFNLNVKSKKDIINNLFIELQSLQSNYLKTIFKR